MWLTTITKVHSWTNKILTTLVVILMLVTLTAMFAQAVDRYFIHSTIFAYDQIAKISMIWLCFLGLPVVFLKRVNISADLIVELLPKKLVIIRTILFDFIIMFLAIVLVWFGLPVMEVGAFLDIVGVPLTYWSVYLSFNIGMALLVIIKLTQIILTFLDLNSGRQAS